jgi:glycosyltransferase involved in cell wall biosynthesis
VTFDRPPRVSIIVAVYNGEAHVEEALRSLLGQGWADLEVIVVDDGSTDGTPAVLARIAREDRRVIVCPRANSGRPACARNTGLAIARGEYIGFLDHDDFSAPQRIATMVEALDQHPDWVAAFHDIAMVDVDGRPLAETYLGNGRFSRMAGEVLRPLGGNWYASGEGYARFACLNITGMHTQSVLIARRRLGEFDLRFDEDFLICEDTDMWMRLALTGPVGFLDRVLGSYRRHPASLTTREVAFLQSAIQVHVHNFERVRARFDAATLKACRRRIAEHCVALGWHFQQQSQMAAARRSYRQALRWWLRPRYVRMLALAFVPRGLLRLAMSARAR